MKKKPVVEKRVTGTMFVRETSSNSVELRSGHKLIYLCGILQVPEDYPLEGEHQYVVTGDQGDAIAQLLEDPTRPSNTRGLRIHLDLKTDLSKHRFVSMESIGGVLEAPIWRV